MSHLPPSFEQPVPERALVPEIPLELRPAVDDLVQTHELESMNVAALEGAVRLPAEKIAELEAFKTALVCELLAISAPDG